MNQYTIKSRNDMLKYVYLNVHLTLECYYPYIVASSGIFKYNRSTF